MRTLLLILLFLCGPVHAQWTEEQKILAAVSMAAMVIDYGQTRSIVGHPTFYEQNPLLGEHPTMGRVNRHFALSALASYLIADALPSEQRTWFLRGLALVQVGVVAHNVSLGVKMDF